MSSLSDSRAAAQIFLTLTNMQASESVSRAAYNILAVHTHTHIMLT